jgi:hypothetical protein
MQSLKLKGNKMNKERKTDPRFQCAVLSVKYNFDTKTGKLVMDEMNCCGMTGTIKFFETIDKNVSLIETFQMDKLDTTFIKLDGKWEVRAFAIPDNYGKAA